MNTLLWVLAALLAVAFLGAGMMKIVTPREKLVEKMSWAAHASDGQVKALGVVEVLGAIGVVLPAIVDIAPILVPIAATGLAVTMAGAVVVHVKEKEPIASAVPAIVLGLIAVVVAWGRFGPYAF